MTFRLFEMYNIINIEYYNNLYEYKIEFFNMFNL